MSADAAVAIVGGGPVGFTLANFLGQAGIRTCLIERESAIVDYPRAVGIDDEALRSLQAIGLAEAIRPRLVEGPPMRFFDSRWRPIAEIDPPTTEFGWRRRNTFLQPELEAVLRAGAGRFAHVDVRLGWQFEALEDSGARARLVLRDPSGTLTTLAADYVVGCDGGRSSLRAQLGVALDGDTFAQQWLVIDIADDPLDHPFTGMYCDPRRPTVCVHLPGGFRRWEFMLLPGETEAELLDPAMIARLLGRFVPDPAKISIVRKRVYTFHARLAERFRVGRAFLAGDAAHLMPPFAGQGLNSGIRDAQNLAWKLALAATGRAGDTLLDSYEAERRDHVRRMIDLSRRIGRIIMTTSRVGAWARDRLLHGVAGHKRARDYVFNMRFKPPPRYGAGFFAGRGTEDQAVGRMFIQPRVAAGGAERLWDDAVGSGFVIAGNELDPASMLGAEAEPWRAAGARFVAVRGGGELRLNTDTLAVGDVTGRLGAWFAANRAAIAFVRPDRYVAAAAEADGAMAAARTLRGMLA